MRAPSPLAAACLLLAACGGAPAGPSVLLVTLDTTRADRLGCYGHAGAATPRLDALAERGVLFERCVAATPITLPSHATILTGLHPFRHGVRNNGSHRLAPDAWTLAEALSERGHATAAVVSAAVLAERYGLGQGFDLYDDRLSSYGGPDLLREVEARAEDTTDRAVRWLRSLDGARPFFLWVHYFDPHGDYEPPEPFATRFADSPYDGEIAYVDRELGRLLDELSALGRTDETLVAVTADHGESLGEHGERTHGLFVYDATVHVPLLLAHPSLAPGRVEGVVQSVDVFPTLLELAGVDPPEVIDGVSLAALARGADAAPPGRPAYSEAMYPLYNHGWSDLRALRTDGERYVRAPRPELYLLDRDPRESNNVHGDHPELAARLRGELESLLAGGERDETLAPSRLDERTRAELAALGYVWSREGPAAPAGELPDPKDRLPAWREYESAVALAASGRLEEAVPRLRALAERDPGAALVREQLAWALAGLGRDGEALEVLRGALALPGLTTNARLHLAELECRTGSGDWRATIAAAREVDPANPAAWIAEGDCARIAGDFSAARAAYREALVLGAGFEAHRGLALAVHGSGDAEGARAALEAAAATSGDSATGRFNLALLSESLGRAAEAERGYREALERDPSLTQAAVNLGALRLRAGRASEAAELFRGVLERHPAHYGARLNLALAAIGEGRDEEARAHLAECARLRPGERRPRTLLLGVLRRLGEDREVLELARDLLRDAPRLFPALTAAAVSSARLGLADEARALVERARKANAARLERRSARDPELAALLGR